MGCHGVLRMPLIRPFRKGPSGKAPVMIECVCALHSSQDRVQHCSSATDQELPGHTGAHHPSSLDARCLLCAQQNLIS